MTGLSGIIRIRAGHWFLLFAVSLLGISLFFSGKDPSLSASESITPAQDNSRLIIIDPGHGLLVGLQGHGFMLGQYLAKMYVDRYMGRPGPDYADRLLLSGDGLCENAFK